MSQTAMRANASKRPAGSPILPDVKVIDQTGRAYRFYEELIRGRIAFIHCFSLAEGRGLPILENIRRVADLLESRLGNDVRICSLASDPTRDSVDAIAVAADRLKTPQGWHLLTGGEVELKSLRSALYRGTLEPDVDGSPDRRRALASFWGAFGANALCTSGQEEDCSTGLIRYGNDALGLWGSVPSSAEPGQIAARADWITIAAPKARDASVRRGGPRQITFSS